MKDKFGFWDTSFFPAKDEQLFGHFEKREDRCVLTLNINPRQMYDIPRITLYLTQQQLVNFKNSVIQSYEALLRKEAMLRKEAECQ